MLLDAATARLDRLGGVHGTDDDPSWAPIIEAMVGTGATRVAVVGLEPVTARTSSGRFLCEHVTFSSVGSVSQLAALANRRRPAVARNAAFVVDPCGDGTSGPAAAAVLRRTFYPRAIGLGRGDEWAYGRGTPDDVLAQLPGPGRPGASMLYLDCRLRPAGEPALELEGYGGPAPLEASRIAPREHGDNADGGLVVFSSASGTSYEGWGCIADAMVAAGASGVIGWRWPIAAPIAALMDYVLHTELVSRRRPPADAVAEVRRWMLDPARRIPAGLPWHYVARAGNTDLTDPRFWGALCYRGQ